MPPSKRPRRGASMAGHSPWGDVGVPHAVHAEINITPLVDVVLVVLVLLLVSATAAMDATCEGRLTVALPQAGHANSRASDGAVLVLGLGEKGELYVDGEAQPSATLTALLAQKAALVPPPSVIVDADGAVSHKDVVRLLDAVRAAGFAQVGIGASLQPP